MIPGLQYNNNYVIDRPILLYKPNNMPSVNIKVQILHEIDNHVFAINQTDNEEIRLNLKECKLIQPLYDPYVIKKEGFMQKCGHSVQSWKTRWFVLS